MSELEKLQTSLKEVRFKQSKLFKEKAASPKDILKKAQVYAGDISKLIERITQLEFKRVLEKK